MRKVLIGILLGTAAVSAAAQDGNGYVGAGAGVSSYSIDGCDQLPPGFSCDESGFAWKVFAGYMFLPYIGIEGGYNDFGAANTQGVLLNPPAGTIPLPSNADVYTQVWSLSLVGRIPLGPAAIMGRVGYGSVMAKISGLGAMPLTISGLSTPPADRPRKMSAPGMTSARARTTSAVWCGFSWRQYRPAR